MAGYVACAATTHTTHTGSQHSQDLWTSFLGGMPHLKTVHLIFFGGCNDYLDEWSQHRVPHVLALLKTAEAAQWKLHVQVFTGTYPRCVCSGTRC